MSPRLPPVPSLSLLAAVALSLSSPGPVRAEPVPLEEEVAGLRRQVAGLKALVLQLAEMAGLETPPDVTASIPEAGPTRSPTSPGSTPAGSGESGATTTPVDPPSDRLAALDARTRETSRRQQILTGEVRTLRERLVLPEQKERIPRYGMGPAASKVYDVPAGVSLGGYGQGFLRKFTSEKGSNPDTFDFVRFVLYTGYKFTENLILNAELEWEHASTGAGGSASVEFAQLDWLRPRGPNFRAGLLLAPIGFLNEQHEPTTFHGNRRPEVERRIIPSTWREGGAGIFGTAGSKLDYRVYVMNSLRGSRFSASGIRGGRQKGGKTLAEHHSLAARADYRASPHLTLGGSIYAGDQGQNEAIAIDALGTMRTPDAHLTLVEAHAEYRNRGLRLRALEARSRLGDADVLSAAQAVMGNGPVGSRQEGRYVEASYDLLSRRATSRSLDLFFRFEELDTHAEVPAGFVRDPSRRLLVRSVGLGYRPHPDVVLKLDFRNLLDGTGGGENEIDLGLGWIF